MPISGGVRKAKKACAKKGMRLSKVGAKCVKKRKVGSKLKAFVKAAKAEGYMQKGASFKRLPKKGTAGYKNIMARLAK